jgi:hypothetical protein
VWGRVGVKTMCLCDVWGRVGRIVKTMCLCDVREIFVGILKMIFVSCVGKSWCNGENVGFCDLWGRGGRILKK